MNNIPFNKPYLVGKELAYIQQAHSNGHLSANGPFTKKCEDWLKTHTGTLRAILTHSCTAALEMAAILADIQPGDEVIMPSYTFCSTANAFVLRGGVPVFVDIRPDTLNLDETKIEAAITKKTKAIVAVHYAGVPCEMDVLLSIAAKHKLWVIEDAAQGIGAKYKGRALGSLGHIGALSFHETKNIHSGEGGVLFINDERLLERAEIISEKGTNRKKFMSGLVDKYTWADIGSSYLPSDLIAAFLWAQLENFNSIMALRKKLWNTYHESFREAESKGLFRRPAVTVHDPQNAHMYYLLLPSKEKRDALIQSLAQRGIHAVFHYVPLHTSPAGIQYGHSQPDMDVTKRIGDTLLRLPFWIGLEEKQKFVVESVIEEATKLAR